MDLRKTVNQMHLGRPPIPSAQPVAPATSCPASSSNHLSPFLVRAHSLPGPQTHCRARRASWTFISLQARSAL